MSTDTALCFNCGRTTAAQLVCPGCGVERSAAVEPDYFSLFGLPRSLSIDLGDLAECYYALSRRLHPDLHSDRAPAEQAASLRTTALVNRAYRTLKDPVERALYWLTLHGESLGRQNEQVPRELATLVFDVQEKLDALRDARRAGGAGGEEAELRQIHDRLRARTENLKTLLAAGETDATNGDRKQAVAETKRVLSELHYLRTLVRDLEKELEPSWSA